MNLYLLAAIMKYSVYVPVCVDTSLNMFILYKMYSTKYLLHNTRGTILYVL